MIREFLGNGTFGGGILNGGEGIRILPEGIPALGMVLPVGGFLTLAVRHCRHAVFPEQAQEGR